MSDILNYTLLFEDRGSYLYAHLAGEDSFAASLSYWNEIADKVKELDCSKLLVHENLTGEVTGAEMYDLITDLQQSDLTKIQIAFIDENLDDAALNHMGGHIAASRGANIQIFKSLNDAQYWIEHSS